MLVLCRLQLSYANSFPESRSNLDNIRCPVLSLWSSTSEWKMKLELHSWHVHRKLRSSGCIVTSLLTFMSFKPSVAMYYLFIDEYYDIIKNKRIYEVQSFRSIQYIILYCWIYIYMMIYSLKFDKRNFWFLLRVDIHSYL